MNSPSFLLFDLAEQLDANTRAQDPLFDVQALSFDRVHRGHIVSSAFPLFRIPVELFPHVTRYLTRDDLKTLALVDRDCRRLASLNLFRDVYIDVGPKTQLELLHQYLTSPFPSSIPRCVRRLVVKAAFPGSIIDPPPPVPSSTASLPGRSSNDESISVSRTIFHILGHSTPNLHVLELAMPVLSLKELLSALHLSPVKHLSLKGAVTECDITVGSSSLPQVLALETLELDILPSPQSTERRSQDSLRHLFLCVAPTLRQLVWKGGYLTDGDDSIDPGTLFPGLRYLTLSLDIVSPSIPPFFRSLLGQNVKVQSLFIDAMSSMRRFFVSRGCIESLKHFSWIDNPWTELPLDNILQFLQQNPQLETIHIPQPLGPTFIKESLLPLLSPGHYDVLTSLHLIWDADVISEVSIQQLALISSLRHLWLSAGNQGMRSTWEVDHDAMIKYLSPLHSLETLAFSHDTYPTNAHPLAPRFCDYYATKAMPVDLDITRYLTPEECDIYHGRIGDYDLAIAQQIRMRRRAWERWHVERMEGISNMYGRTFHRLRWCFVGQVPFGRGPPETEFSVDNHPPKREPCLSSLHRKMDIGIWRPV